MEDCSWISSAVLNTTITLMISNYGYGAVLEAVAEKMFEEAEYAEADGVVYYSRKLAKVAESVAAAANELAFAGIT
jgi:hypothetical protein